MEKRLRKNIQKEFRKFVKNISGEDSHNNQGNGELSRQIQSEAATVETRRVEVPCDAPLHRSQNEVEDVHSSDKLECSSTEQPVEYDPMDDLCKNFHSMLEKDLFTDVTIKCGDEVLKAHKVVLCARSPVFEAMFSSSEYKESRDNEVTVQEIDPGVFRDLLDFIYSGQTNNLTVSKACDLLYAAEKYQVRTLKQLCVNYLKKNLAVDNAFQILLCADLYDLQLRRYTLKYISDEFSAIEATEDWKTIQTQNPNIALEVYSAVVKYLKGKG